ncbi:MAG: hypothetical protein V4568_08385 [Pseudomonadota bacterium]
MNFKYRLPDKWITQVADMEEFANGATQVSVELKSGQIIHGVLVSMSTYLVATRGFKGLPFAIDDIKNIFQTDEDKNPKKRDGWDF